MLLGAVTKFCPTKAKMFGNRRSTGTVSSSGATQQRYCCYWGYFNVFATNKKKKIEFFRNLPHNAQHGTCRHVVFGSRALDVAFAAFTRSIRYPRRVRPVTRRTGVVVHSESRKSTPGPTQGTTPRKWEVRVKHGVDDRSSENDNENSVSPTTSSALDGTRCSRMRPEKKWVPSRSFT